ncbi:MAG: hypothetical protein H7039_09840 [Bryobacteraceae bacterium]|nr:hypothetical protein [Bryobacteraceae bacterium]
MNVQVPEDIVRELGSDTKTVERALLEGLALVTTGLFRATVTRNGMRDW